MKGSIRARRAAWTLALGVLCILSTAPPSLAQQAEIDSLASRVAQEIAKTGKKKVAVADFVAVNGKNVPLGVWLADQFSAALAKADPKLEIIDRAKVKAALEAKALFSPDSLWPDAEELRRLCQSVGAEVLGSATLGPAQRTAGITLNSFDCIHPHNFLTLSTRGKIPLTPEMESLLPEPLESLLLPDGVWRAGQGGAGEPSCISCPSPSFPDAAARSSKSGIVMMEVTVTAKGHVTEIKVIKAAGYGFDERAMEEVRGWKLKPALSPDGVPIAARTLIEVTFRMRPT